MNPESLAIDEYMKVLCLTCHHTRAWHLPILPSNINLSIIKEKDEARCRRHPCLCAVFKEK